MAAITVSVERESDIGGLPAMIDLKRSLFLVISCSVGVTLMLTTNPGAAAHNSSTSADQSGEALSIRQSFLAHTTPGDGVAATAKLCSAVHQLSFNWRDTIIVPDNWQTSTCQTFARSLGGTHYQLGCANPHSFSWGDKEGSLPVDNQCRW